MSKQAFFNTLSESLESENIEFYPFWQKIDYNQTVSYAHDGLFVSIYRAENGKYERPVYYKTLCEDFVKIQQH